MPERNFSPYATVPMGHWPNRRNISPSAASRQVGSVVYVMRLPDGLVKIGWTHDLMARRRSLRSRAGVPDLEVLAFMPGTPADEQAIHTRLTDHLHHGREWYYPTSAVMREVNQMRSALGLEPIAA